MLIPLTSPYSAVKVLPRPPSRSSFALARAAAEHGLPSLALVISTPGVARRRVTQSSNRCFQEPLVTERGIARILQRTDQVRSA
jgi:hypothetical protein